MAQQNNNNQDEEQTRVATQSAGAGTSTTQPETTQTNQQTTTDQDTETTEERVEDQQDSMDRMIENREKRMGSVDDMETKEVEPAQVPDVETPDPTAAEEAVNYTESVQKNVERTKNNYQQRLKQERERINEEINQTEKRIAELKEEREGTMDEVEDLTEPFRQELEKKERKRLQVEENFRENQNLIDEMESLLTESNQLVEKIKQQRIPGLAGLQQSSRAQKRLDDVNARVGVIESVMAARRNQMADAERLIDRTEEAITADRKDQLNYYKTLLDYTEQERGEERQELLTLEEEDKKFMEEQISIVEQEMDQARETSNYIKELMTDPNTANIIAQSGVKLTDSVEEINKKFAEYALREERNNMDQNMIEEGFKHLTLPEQYNNKPENELRRLKDSAGEERVYWKPQRVYWKPQTEEETDEEDQEEMYEIGGITVSSKTANIINGAYSFDDLPANTAEERADRLMVMEELNELGFNSEIPPEWYKEQFQAALDQFEDPTPSAISSVLGYETELDKMADMSDEEIIQKSWKKDKNKIMTEVRSSGDDEEEEESEEGGITEADLGVTLGDIQNYKESDEEKPGFLGTISEAIGTRQKVVGFSENNSESLISLLEDAKESGLSRDEALERAKTQILSSKDQYSPTQARKAGLDEFVDVQKAGLKEALVRVYGSKERTINLNELDEE